MKHTNVGLVKFFKKDSGFGFIKDEASGQDIFVHATGLNDEIREGDKVAFNLKEGKKGLNAIDCVIID
jgi:cold shock protein